VWHRRLDYDPALVWVRGLIGEAAGGRRPPAALTGD